MKFPNFMKRFWFKEQKKETVNPREEILDKTQEEIKNIIESWNYQWENFNKIVGYIEDIIVWIFKLNMSINTSRLEVYQKNLWLALLMPWFMAEEYFNHATKDDADFKDIWDKNQVTRVSVDSLRRDIVLKVLDEILKISSSEEFWYKNYKIWKIEINSFEDLQQHREELENMYEKFENYDIPWYKEAVEYAAKNGINTIFYS